MNTFISYPKCSTCQKAKKFLDDRGFDYLDIDIKLQNPNYELLKEIYQKSGLDIKKFFNTSGMIYREMNLKDKLENMTEDEKLNLLASNGMLVKRPIFYNDKIVLVGFKEKDWQKIEQV